MRESLLSLHNLPSDLLAKLLDIIDVVEPGDTLVNFEQPKGSSLYHDPFPEDVATVPSSRNTLLPLRGVSKILQAAVDGNISNISVRLCADLLTEAAKFDVTDPNGRLPRLLLRWPRLTHMSLYLKDLPLLDFEAILSTFAASCPTLQQLRLNVDLRDEPQSGSQICLDTLRSFPSLQGLGVEGTCILTRGDAHFPALPALHFLKLYDVDKLHLAPAPNLRELIVFSRVYWGPPKLIDLRHLHCCPSLERLHLHALPLTALQLPQSIKNLHLSNLSLDPGLDFNSMALPVLEHLYLGKIELKQQVTVDSLMVLLQRVQLRSLTLYGFRSVGTTDFTMQTRLEMLRLDIIEEVHALSPPTSLATLQLHRLHVSSLNFHGVSSLRNLQMLDCRLDIVSGIENLSSVQLLEYSGSQGMYTLGPLQGLTELVLVTNCGSVGIPAPLPDFSHFSALRSLKVKSYCQYPYTVPKLSGGHGVTLPPHLKVLSIDRFDQDIQQLPLCDLKHLQTLALYRLQLVGDLESVQLEALQELNIGRLDDMTAIRLSGLKRLLKLHVRACNMLKTIVLHEGTALESARLVACTCLSVLEVSETANFKLEVEGCPMMGTSALCLQRPIR